jgi:hypothetical protein
MAHLTPGETIERINTKENITFIRWQGEFKSATTASATVMCDVHNIEFTRTVKSLMGRTATHCPECQLERLGNNSRKPDSEMVDSFMATGKFVEGTTFTRSGKMTGKRRIHWDMYCPVCATDDYATAGLCTGVFTVTRDAIVRGGPPCRCTPTAINLTDEQWEFRIKQKLSDMDKGLSYVGVTRGKTWSRSMLHLYCEDHADFDLAVFSLLFMGQGCASCSKTGFDRNKPAHLYVLKIEGHSRAFTGFGVSNQIAQRMKHHAMKLAREGLTITDTWTTALDGDTAHDVELRLMREFPIVNQNISGFIKEATHIDYFPDVVRFVETVLLPEVELLAIL